MISIANSDYAKVKRLLSAFSNSDSVSLKGKEERRQALLLLRKWEKREKRSKIASNSKDDKLYIQGK